MSIEESYFDWLLKFVTDDEYANDEFVENHKLLMIKLYSIEFKWYIANDDNRALDGIAMRDKFAYDNKIDEYSDLTGPCNILEMLVALASRCENDIMGNDPSKDRSGFWFWKMIENSGLSLYVNDNFNSDEVDKIVETIIERRYDSMGNGGLFPLKSCSENAKTMEIWYQMSFWLQENFDIE